MSDGLPDAGAAERSLSRRRLLGATTLGAGLFLATRPPAPAMAEDPPVDATPAVSGEYNLRDFGAVGDGGTDDGPALQRALDQLASAGGGTLIVPPGKYAISSPVSRNFSHAASQIVIRGVGSSSQLLLKTGAGSTAIAISSLSRTAWGLVISSLTFLGTTGAYPDVKRGLYINATRATLRDCQFFNLAANETGGAVLYNQNSDVRLEGCNFIGCSGESSRLVPVMDNDAWIGLTVENTIFWDIGELNGEGVVSKVNSRPPYAWIRMRTPNPVNSSSQAQREVRLVRVIMDEGAYRAFAMQPAAGERAQHVYFDGVRVNGWSGTNGIGALITCADRVTLQRCWFGQPGRGKSPATAVSLGDVGDAVLEEIICTDAITALKADKKTRSLSVVNCDYTTLSSEAKTTSVMSGGRQEAPLSLGDTTAPTSSPADGGLLYAEGGALKWRSASGTVTTIAPA